MLLLNLEEVSNPILKYYRSEDWYSLLMTKSLIRPCLVDDNVDRQWLIELFDENVTFIKNLKYKTGRRFNEFEFNIHML